jgi:hypothetical protein
MNEFIDWTGGECPVSDYTLVEVRLRNDVVEKLPANEFDWTHFGEEVEDGDSDIIAYRVLDGIVQ